MKNASGRRWIVLAVLLVLVLVGAGFAARAHRDDPEVARVRELRNELLPEAGRNLPPDDRHERWKKVGEETKQLSPGQRRDLWSDRQRGAMRPPDRHFSPPPQQQVAQVGQEVSRTDPVRRPWGPERPKGPPPGFGGPFAGPFGGRPPAPTDERERRRSEWLEYTSPEDRAKTAEYLRQLEARRQPPAPPASDGAEGR